MKGLSFNILKYKAKDFLLRYLKRFFNGKRLQAKHIFVVDVVDWLPWLIACILAKNPEKRAKN